MFDLHSHLLPGIDDGSPNMRVSFEMARAYVDQGVLCVACTPHILPGLYHNTGPQIREAAAALQRSLDEAGIPLHIATGADNHIIPDFVEGLRRGHLLALDDTAYVLVEPPHHVALARLEDLFFSILVAGYVPILTHPERLTWIEGKYDVIERLSSRGVWMQVTAGSLLGRFGRRPRYWAQRMLEEGRVHILATDAHNNDSRPPDLLKGREAAAKIVGEKEAHHLVVTRPLGVLKNLHAGGLPEPEGITSEEVHEVERSVQASDSGHGRSLRERVRRLLA
ncbi:capsular biosynthesis protein [Rhodomicrobium vannielii ATCC 17100]|uniref:tyrosine-protein phosphatase n=1 Tax=Rhodomicrobium vannielii TaxID=1069 RepID=UPI001918AF68|nr:CpsB/CapC family capsule biosynthesis tyrosine phosphatase [Rhodomicrobium vannielii]MBJ7532978.1 capsular biosynthesis protein [Rhodomicrobium vannielii ATCC 17100]